MNAFNQFNEVFVTYLSAAENAAENAAEVAASLGLPPLTGRASYKIDEKENCIRVSIALTRTPYSYCLLDAAGNRWKYVEVDQPNFYTAGRTRLEYEGAAKRPHTPEEEYLFSHMGWENTTPGKAWFKHYHKCHFPGRHAVSPWKVEEAWQDGRAGFLHRHFTSDLETEVYRIGLQEYGDRCGAGSEFVAYATNPNYIPKYVDVHFYRLYDWRFGEPPVVEATIEEILSSSIVPATPWQELLLREAKRWATASQRQFVFSSTSDKYAALAREAYRYAVAMG